MTDDVVIDGSLFFRRRSYPRATQAAPLRALYLRDVGVCELMFLLRHTDLAISTDAEGRNVLHRKPTPPGAA